MEKKLIPQQTPGSTGTRPPKGWVPPLDAVLTLLGVFDNDSGYWVGLPLQALTKALLVSEALDANDRIDERNSIVLTIPNGTAQGTVKTQTYQIPSGEVWYLNRLNLVTETEVTGNIRISRFPKSDSVDKAYLGTDLAAGQNTNYDLKAAGQLGADLRLAGGDIITVVGTAAVAGGTTADRKVTLHPFGHKANRLV
jgi:hypothetical protein